MEECHTWKHNTHILLAPSFGRQNILMVWLWLPCCHGGQRRALPQPNYCARYVSAKPAPRASASSMICSSCTKKLKWKSTFHRLAEWYHNTTNILHKATIGNHCWGTAIGTLSSLNPFMAVGRIWYKMVVLLMEQDTPLWAQYTLQLGESSVGFQGQQNVLVLPLRTESHLLDSIAFSLLV